MSMFEKIILPLVDDNISFGDVAPYSGFVDSYTADPDKPCGENVLYLTYDDTIRTEQSKKCATRIESLSTVKHTYVKVVNNKPIMVYKLYIKPEIKKLFNGIIELTPKQVSRIFEFWGYNSDVATYICENKRKSLCVEHNMPLEDYVPRFG